MKKLAAALVAAFLCSISALAQSTCTPVAGQYSCTPNLGLPLPSQGYLNWGPLYINAMGTLDTTVGALQSQYQGTWASTSSYAKGQTVTYSGSLYQSLIAANLNNNPSTATADWVQIVGGGGGGGGLTGNTSGPLAPLFTTSLGANPLTSPALAFTAAQAAQNGFLAGPASGGAGAYSFRNIALPDLPAGVAQLTDTSSQQFAGAVTIPDFQNEIWADGYSLSQAICAGYTTAPDCAVGQALAAAISTGNNQIVRFGAGIYSKCNDWVLSNSTNKATVSLRGAGWVATQIQQTCSEANYPNYFQLASGGSTATYAVGNILTVGGSCSGATVQVTSVNNGAITGIETNQLGTGCAVSNGVATTGGAGSGATVNVIGNPQMVRVLPDHTFADGGNFLVSDLQLSNEGNSGGLLSLNGLGNFVVQHVSLRDNNATVDQPTFELGDPNFQGSHDLQGHFEHILVNNTPYTSAAGYAGIQLGTPTVVSNAITAIPVTSGGLFPCSVPVTINIYGTGGIPADTPYTTAPSFTANTSAISGGCTLSSVTVNSGGAGVTSDAWAQAVTTPTESYLIRADSLGDSWLGDILCTGSAKAACLYVSPAGSGNLQVFNLHVFSNTPAGIPVAVEDHKGSIDVYYSLYCDSVMHWCFDNEAAAGNHPVLINLLSYWNPGSNAVYPGSSTIHTGLNANLISIVSGYCDSSQSSGGYHPLVTPGSGPVGPTGFNSFVNSYNWPVCDGTGNSYTTNTDSMATGPFIKPIEPSNGVAALPAIGWKNSVTGAYDDGIYWANNSDVRVTLAGVDAFRVSNDTVSGLVIPPGYVYGFGSSGVLTPDTYFQRTAAGILGAGTPASGTGATLQAQAYQIHVGAAVASASTIAPTSNIFHLTGTAPVSTITILPGMSASIGGVLHVIADGASSVVTGGNIADSCTFSAGTAYTWVNEGTSWYVGCPSSTGASVTSLNSLTGAVNIAAGSNVTLTPSGNTITIASTSTASTAFSALTGSTNNAAAMVVGTGASLSATGSGTIAATSAPYSGLTGSAPTWNQSTTGNAATATTAANLSGTPALPSGTTATTQAAADNTAKIATDAFVLANSAPLASPAFTGTVDASGATQMKLPTHAGYTAAVGGEIGYDSTNGNAHANYAGTDLILAGFPSASLPTSGNCAEFTEIGAWWEITDSGVHCGGGSGTVTTVSVATANGVSGTVANATTTPAITLSLGAITPTSVAATGAISGSSFSTTPVAGQPGYSSFYAGTTLPTLPAGNFTMFGPNASSVTAFGWQVPAATNSSAGIMHVAANASAVSQLSVSAITPSDAAGSTTGSGNFVLATSPNLVTPALGTPASGVITSLTGTCTSCGVGGNAATATGISTSGTANQVWGMNAGATAQGWQTVSGGGSLPSSSAGQTYANIAGTPVATSAITPTSASAGAPLGFGNTAPVAQLDFSGGENHLALNTANIVPTATCTATATSCAVNNVTGLNPTGGYAIMNVNAASGPPEIVAYSSASGTTITFDTSATFCSGATAGRGCFGTTAASQNTAAQIVPVNVMWTTANANSPALIYYWYSNAPFVFLLNGNSFSQGSTTAGFNTPSIGTGTLYFNTQGTGTTNMFASPGGGLEVVNASQNPVSISAGTVPSRNVSAQSITATSLTAITATTTQAVAHNNAAASNTVQGQMKADCTIMWQQATGIATVQFGVKLSAAPTALYVTEKDYAGTGGAVSDSQVTTLTTTTTTATSPTVTPTAFATTYFSELTLIMNPGTTNSPTVQLYGLTSNAADALTIEPGSGCTPWH